MKLMDEDKAKEVLRGLLYETAMNNIRYAHVYEDLAKNRMDIWFNLIPTVEAVPTDFHDKCQQIEIEKRLKLEEAYRSMERTVEKLTKALADAEPIRHAHWVKVDEDSIEEHNIYKCSECGELYDWFDVPEHKYCRHCGAKMDADDTYSTGHNEKDTEVTE